MDNRVLRFLALVQDDAHAATDDGAYRTIQRAECRTLDAANGVFAYGVERPGRPSQASSYPRTKSDTRNGRTLTRYNAGGSQLPLGLVNGAGRKAGKAMYMAPNPDASGMVAILKSHATSPVKTVDWRHTC
jgi:hypothetical protein